MSRLAPSSSGARPRRTAWPWLALWLGGLAACAALGRYTHSPFPWVFLILAVLSACSSRALSSPLGRRLLLSLTTTWLALASVEALLLSVLADRTLDRETEYGQMLAYRPGLGGGPQPGVWRNRSWLGWQELYEATYTIDENGWRTTGPPPQAPTGSLLCLGGSFTFGQGLQDEQSWPWLVASELGPEVQVVNLGAPGWGPAQMLALAESSELDEALAAPPRVAVYLAISGHPQRVTGDAPWSEGFPRYEPDEEGVPRRRGSHGKKTPTRERSSAERFLRRNLRRSALVRRLLQESTPGNPTDQADQIEPWAAVVGRTAEVLRERYSDLRLVVLFWDDSGPERDRWSRQEAMISALEERGLEVVRLSTWLPDLREDPRWRIPHDRHPSAPAAAELARGVTAWWGKSSAR